MFIHVHDICFVVYVVVLAKSIACKAMLYFDHAQAICNSGNSAAQLYFCNNPDFEKDIVVYQLPKSAAMAPRLVLLA